MMKRTRLICVTAVVVFLAIWCAGFAVPDDCPNGGDTPPVVPAPGALLLVGLGTGGVAYLRRHHLL